MIRAGAIAFGLALIASQATAQAPKAKAAPKVPPDVMKSLQDVAAKQLRDAPSARWEELRYAVQPNLKGEPTPVVCGYLNGKNAYGGYIGRQPFAFLVEKRLLVMAGGGYDASVVKTALDTMCKGLI